MVKKQTAKVEIPICKVVHFLSLLIPSDRFNLIEYHLKNVMQSQSSQRSSS